MQNESRHISVRVGRPVEVVYAFASDPANLSAWAQGLGSSAEQIDGQWWLDSPAGRVAVSFAPHNDYGVLDHAVTLPSGETVDVPMRVIADGEGSEVVFTLRRQPGVTDEEFARDAEAVTADLAALKRLLESGSNAAPPDAPSPAQ